jgi:hypothetical protein
MTTLKRKKADGTWEYIQTSEVPTDTTSIQTDISNMKLDITALQTGGSGTLVYQTLANLQTAYPNGINQPAWIVADNSWYYWDGVVTADTTAPLLTITSGGTFTGTKSVTMSTNETATIYYTIDGTTPTISSSVYSSALSLSSTTTLKAFAKDTAGNSSAIQTVTYTLGSSDTTAPIVTASPVAGTYTSTQTVTLTANETATIYYTLDGSTPTTGSTVYSSPISVSTTKTLKYFAVDTAGNQSTVQTNVYTINIPDTTAPVLTITPAATFSSTQTVTMSATDASSYTIWYTVDGTDPTSSGTKVQYTTPITLSATTTVKAYAVDSANNASAVQTVVYTKQVSTYQYLQLNGGTDKVQIPNSTSLQLSNNFTISIKFSYDADTSTGNSNLIDKSADYQISWNGTNHKAKFYGIPTTGTIPSYTLAETTISDTNPHTLQYQYDGTTFKMLLDGTQLTSGASTFTLAQTTAVINVMSGIKGRLYSVTIVKAGTTVLNMDCTTGTVADQSGNNNNGTLTGGSFVS